MQRNVPLSLILVRESGGHAHAVARINDPVLVQRCRDAVVREKRTEARETTDPFTRRKAEMEARLIEEA